MSNDIEQLRRELDDFIRIALREDIGEGDHSSLACIPADKPGKAVLKVKDTGIGIPPENHEKIFRQFFQSDIPGSMVNQGSGIGLAITKKFVRLHGGTISVQSAPGEGSCFTVILPVATALTAKPVAEPVVQEIQVPEPAVNNLVGEAQAGGKNGKKPVVLLIEDNEDFRFYLKDIFQAYYTIKEAADGKQGWQQVLACNPDLVVSDIMMPEMDGLTMCRKIRSHEATNHIPVVMLTAKADKHSKLKGLETGADIYIAKPFDANELMLIVGNLLKRRKQLQELIAKKQRWVAQADHLEIEDCDRQFIDKLNKIMELNYSREGFGVEEFTLEAGMSRAQLYRKIKAITGVSTGEFIRNFRMAKACALLASKNTSVGELAYKVGFSSQSNFIKSFKDQFGHTPGEYKVLLSARHEAKKTDARKTLHQAS